MARPPYLTIMLLNPIESEIQHIQKEEYTAHCEESLITRTSSENSLFNNSRILIPKKRLTKVLWFVVSFAVAHSWFSFTLSISKLHHYYGNNFMMISSVFWAFPLMTAIVVPIFSNPIQKINNPLVPLMIAAFANSLGCAIKCTGTEKNGFPIIIAGQLVNMLALPISLGYHSMYSMQDKSKKWPISSLWIASVASGSTSGLCLLPLLLAEKENSEDIGLQIYKYFLWSAFLSIIPLVLIPFAMKEQNQFSGTDYRVFSASRARVGDDENQDEQNSSNFFTSALHNLKSQLSTFREKKFLTTVSASGISLGLFLNIFPASAIYIDMEARKIWQLCIVESIVVLTLTIYVFVALKAKFNIPRWLIVGNNMLLIASAIIFVLFKPLSLRLFLIYCLHALSGLNCFIFVRDSLLQAHSMAVLPAMIFIEGLFASVACCFLLALLWKFSIGFWTALFCLLSLISGIYLFLSL